MLAQPKLPTSTVLHIRRRQAERTCLIITSNNTNRQMELSERYQRAWNGRRKTGLERLQGKPSGYHCVRGGGLRRLGPSRLLRTVPSTIIDASKAIYVRKNRVQAAQIDSANR